MRIYPKVYFDESTGVYMLVFENPFIKRLLFSQQVDADDLIAALDRIEACALPGEVDYRTNEIAPRKEPKPIVFSPAKESEG